MSDLATTMKIAAAGMNAQTTRLRVVASNMANANSTPQAPGMDPYRRQTVNFTTFIDREMDVELVKVGSISRDLSDFGMRFDPNHPAADEDGYIKTPNVNGLVEMMDMREAQRSYEANLEMLDTARSMASRTLALLK